MLRFRLVMFVFLGCLCGGGVLRAGESPTSFLEASDVPTQEQDRLVRAWAEYGLSNWDLASRLFRQVLQDGKSTAAARLQAEFGLVYIDQYKMPGFNPEGALVQYESLLAKTTPGTADYGVIRKQMAECLLDQRSPNYPQARMYLQEVLQIPAVPKLTRAAAVMDLARSYILEGVTFELDENKNTNLLKAYAVLTQYRTVLSDSGFLPVSRQMTAEIAVLLGDYPRAVEELRTWLESGIRSVRLRATTLFRIARISEVELEDLETAALYYQRLAEEVPSDGRAFWAKERVKQMEDGKDNHFARPPLTRIPPRDIAADLVEMMKSLFGEDARLPDAPDETPKGDATSPPPPDMNPANPNTEEGAGDSVAPNGGPTDEYASEDVAP